MTKAKIGRNAPCPCGSGKKYKHCCMGKVDFVPSVVEANEAPDSSELLDFTPRLIERELARVGRLMNRGDFASEQELNDYLKSMTQVRDLPDIEPQTPLERAQDLMYEAWDETNSRRRAKLARQALEISPDCADAYVLLAEETARSAKEALPLYEKGVAAGERAIGPEGFEEYAGDFWGMLETRPYMRARLGLAQVLAELRRYEEASEHAWELLRLNPGDNQGVRYFLLGLLITMGDDEGADSLLAMYPDDATATWLYGRALVKFRTLGDSIFSRRALLTAVQANPNVPLYFFGAKQLPDEPPPLMGFGDESEAQWYVATGFLLWDDTPGAFDWMRDAVEEAAEMKPELDAARTGPSFFLNPYEYHAFTRCPECGEKTKVRVRYLLVLVEPSHLTIQKMQTRYCEEDDLLIVHQRDLEAEMAASVQTIAPEIIGNDYVVVGVIEREDMRQRPAGPLAGTWATDHVKAFRELYEYTDPWEEWYWDYVDELAGPELDYLAAAEQRPI